MKLNVGFLFFVFFLLVTSASFLSKSSNGNTPVVEVKKETSPVMSLVRKR